MSYLYIWEFESSYTFCIIIQIEVKSRMTEKTAEKTAEKESSKPVEQPVNRVILRDISRGIFFYPLAIYSFIAAIIEHIGESGEPSQPWVHANVLSIIWIVLFFTCVFIVSFDLSVGKFIGLVFLLVLVVLVIIFITLNNPPMSEQFVFNIQLRTQFYWMTAALLGVILLLTLMVAQFRYVKMERNEVLIKGILGDVRRFPTASLNYEKKIPDVFKYMLLGSGTIILHLPGVSESVELSTVVNVHKKARQMDAILSAVRISR
jgi:hypothetical protein